MKIRVAKSAGFCWGVKRAVNIAVEAAKKGKGKAYCLGELIHNKREIERLKALGMDFVEDMEALETGNTVIIRSHGVAPQVFNYLKEKGLEIVDATCPFVKEIHDKVTKLEKEGYPVLILGNPKHPEVRGIAGHIKDPIIVNSLEELEELPQFSKLGVVCQTTLNMDFFRKAVSLLALKAKELKVYNTICKATTVRQKETRELASQVDVMLIVGGKNSSNTTKLYQISKSVNERSYHIESKEEIDPSWFEGAEVVGVTAGASTPQWVIDEVVDYLRLLGEGGNWSGRGVCQAAGR
ncbi:4-hydroxy-3-methylbut-2-enyl diphosphate reductase [Phorcysia thermohydrogeniphila]|uniref:4-hydroxy-3-methylbut-2-enyl diphosphate reductase n=1 Tax=Phorcysia thermohydrogeniphila TaxID=936138 RepID=A0A4R1G9N0_9BACT|nr:4-hydroxy-3-methylbut-2-enyl diphosphate reductase [Phorcysia thermohydrogeniphila]TCK04624.1 4-hydroxy-3-methylbut-2-enyl diphosphate reductase [Phorcysia thermohydrogeniphila]